MPNTRSSIDEQVVKMSFDNSNFDSNINESIKTLNSLDTRLGLLNKEDFSGLKNNISDLANVFTVKGQIMLGVFTSLGNKIVQVGLDLKNKLFAGIKDGLGEYKLIIDSTQTIYQNVKKYASLDDVNKALDELNDYADLTIYNFSEMTRMIGMFTSAGVSLNKSVATIKGLANAAALVGANSEKAQIAWQAVSRAMSSGTFSNVTWRSLELSNIAGEQFNKVITEVARANNVVGKSGKNIDEMIDKYGSLRLTLSEGWLTKDIFAEAMQIMSGDLNDMALLNKGYTQEQVDELLEIAKSAKEAATQVKTFQQLIDTIKEAIGSGWAQSFRILIGDLDEAKKMFTRINNVVSDFIDNNAKIRNELFTQIVKNQKDQNTTLVDGLKSGRESFQQTIENMMATVKTFFKAVSTGFLNIFPIERISAAAVKVLDTIQKATRALVLNQENFDKEGNSLGFDTERISRVTEAIKDLIKFFRGLASAIDIAWMAFSQPIKAIVQRIPFFNNFFDKTNSGLLGILKKMGTFGDKITVIRNALRNSNFIEKAVGYFIDNINELGEKYPVLGAIISVFKGIKNAVISLKEGFQRLDIKPLSALFGAFKMVVVSIGKGLNFVFELLKKAKDNIDWSFLEGPKNAIVGFIKKLSDYGRGLISFEELTRKIGESLKKVFLKISSLFKKTDNLAHGTGSTKKYYSDLGDTVIKTGNKIQEAWNKIKKFFAPIGEFFKNTFGGADYSLEGISKKLLLIGGGIGATAGGITILVKELGKAKIISNINDLLNSGIDVIKAYQKQVESKMIINIAIAIGILAASMAVLSFIPYDRLENGLVIFSSFIMILSMALPPILIALAKFNESLGKTKKQLDKFDVMNNLVKQLGTFGKKIASGINAKLVGQAMKDVAISVFILVGAIAALVLLFKLDSKTVIKAGLSVIALMLGMSIAIGGLILVMQLFTKVSEKTKASVTTFASFFKLAGIATVILAIASAVAILVGAIAVISSLNADKMRESWMYIMSMVAMFGLIAMAIGTITSKAKDFGKLKAIAISMVGAMASVSLVLLAMKPLIKTLIDDNSYAWVKAIAIFTAVIAQFTAMIVTLLFVAKKIGGRVEIWDKLDKFMLMVTFCIMSISTTFLAISLMKDVTPEVVSIIENMTIALGFVVSLLALIAIVISRAKTTFSTNFATVIEKISFSIASVISSIGVMALGIAALVAALTSLNIKDSDVKAVGKNMVNKLGMIVKVIVAAIPELRAMFYSLGWAVGSMVTSFVAGLVDNIVSTGELFLSIADKFVNLIIDVLKKVVDIIHSRKEDIKTILRKVIDIIGEIVTEVVNDFFRRDENSVFKKPFTEDQVLKFLGIGGLAIGGGSIALKIAADFNTAATSAKNLAGLLKIVASHLGLMWNSSNGILRNLNMNSRILLYDISELKIVQGLGNGIAKILSVVAGRQIEYTNAVHSSKYAWVELLVIIAAVAAAINAVKWTVHALRQQAGKEAQYIRSDIKNVGDFIIAFISDTQLRTQIAIYGITALAKVVMKTITGLGALLLTPLVHLAEILKILVGIAAELHAALFPDQAEFARSFSSQFDDLMNNVKYFRDTLANDALDLSDIFDPEMPDYFVDGAKQQFGELGSEAGEAYMDSYASTLDQNKENAYGINYSVMEYANKGGMDALSKYKDALGEMIHDTDEFAQEIMKTDWREASPSKVTRDIYYNVMMGSILGLKDGEESFYNYVKRVNDTAAKLTVGSSIDAVNAWSEILTASGISDIQYNSLRNTHLEIYDQTTNQKKIVDLNQQYLELLLAEKDAYVGLNRQWAANHLQQQIQNAGLIQDNLQLIDVIDAVFTAQIGKAEIAAESIALLDKVTALSIADIFGKSVASTDMALQDAAANYAEMVLLAEDHKEELVGMKEDEVRQFLKEEALKRGMSEKNATEYSKMISSLMFAELGTNAEISQDEVDDKLDQFAREYQAFYELEKDKTRVAQEQAKARVAATVAAWSSPDVDKISEKMRTGNMTPDELRDWQRTYMSNIDDISSKVASGAMTPTEYQEWVRNNKPDYKDYTQIYKDLQKAQEEIISQLFRDSGMSENNVEKYWEEQYKEALNLRGKVQSSERGTFSGIFDYLRNLLNVPAPELDLSSWDFTSGFGGTDGLLSDQDTASAIDAAADLKDGLEANRADLTPTFDLDQLASDANKANGIVMSSLMAAQNASIGDYINKDSELNPFMKDRWQNVYNFTQNNYSPKALSRIDIYRQTQRQLSMSRGF